MRPCCSSTSLIMTTSSLLKTGTCWPSTFCTELNSLPFRKTILDNLPWHDGSEAFPDQLHSRSPEYFTSARACDFCLLVDGIWRQRCQKVPCNVIVQPPTISTQLGLNRTAHRADGRMISNIHTSVRRRESLLE